VFWKTVSANVSSKISYGKNNKLSLWKQEEKQVSNELNTPSLMTIEL